MLVNLPPVVLLKLVFSPKCLTLILWLKVSLDVIWVSVFGNSSWCWCRACRRCRGLGRAVLQPIVGSMKLTQLRAIWPSVLLILVLHLGKKEKYFKIEYCTLNNPTALYLPFEYWNSLLFRYPVFHTVGTVSIGLKNLLRVGTSIP